MALHRRRLALAGATAALLALGACGSPSTTGSTGSTSAAGASTGTGADGCRHESDAAWQQVIDKAKAEGTVNMYSTLVPAIQDNLEAAFEATYPEIDLKITRILGQQISTTLDAEKSTGSDGADIVNHVNYDWLFTHENEGYFVQPIGPSSAGPAWKGTKNLIDDLFQVSNLTAIGFAYRTDLIATPPANYEDLLGPDYSDGRLGITNAQGNPSASVAWNWIQQQYGADYLTRMAAQQPKVYATSQPALEALLAGEIAATSWATNISVQDAKAKGAPVEFVLPEKAWTTLNLSYLLAWAKHPNAAQVLFDFMACTDGQAALNQGNVSVQPDIPGVIARADEVSPADLDQLVDTAWVDQYGAAWAADFGR